jgi:hypothetical protein
MPPARRSQWTTSSLPYSIAIALDGRNRQPRALFRFAAPQRQSDWSRRMVAMHLAALKYQENPCL